MPATDLSCDLLIIGGGLAGSALGRAMAAAGHRVVIVEKETRFRDRIRGEVLLPWGSVEAHELGIYGLILESCGREAWQECFYQEGVKRDTRDFRTTTPRATGVLSFFHPEMQEVMLAAAEKAGAVVKRGAGLAALRPGQRPEADIADDGGTTTVKARLIVGADGRESQVATLLGLPRERDDPELFTAGLQFSGDMAAEPALHFLLHSISGRGAIVVKNRDGFYRAYLFHHRDAMTRRLSGERDFSEAVSQFRDVGVPADWLEAVKPSGIFATFDGAHRWITSPACANCVLIGDAAAASDPVWGNGLSRTLRDVRLLRDRLLADADWTAAARAYAADHDAFFKKLRRAERLNAAVWFAMGEEGRERRARAEKLSRDYPDLLPDIAGKGPETPLRPESETIILGRPN